MNVIGTSNLVSLINNMNFYSKNISKSQSALSSGKKNITDNISNIGRISRLNSQISGSKVIRQNIQDGMSYLQSKSAVLTSMQSMGQRFKELSVTYNNGTLSDEDKTTIETEANELLEQMFNTKSSAKFNEKSLFDTDSLTLQTSIDGSNNIQIKPADMSIKKNTTGSGYTVEEPFTHQTFQTNLRDLLSNTSVIDYAILDPLASANSYIGIKMNELEDTLYLQDLNEELSTNTLSNLEDVDMASEMMNMSKNSMLLNATQSLFSQALELSNNRILELLRA